MIMCHAYFDKIEMPPPICVAGIAIETTNEKAFVQYGVNTMKDSISFFQMPPARRKADADVGKRKRTVTEKGVDQQIGKKKRSTQSGGPTAARQTGSLPQGGRTGAANSRIGIFDVLQSTRLDNTDNETVQSTSHGDAIPTVETGSSPQNSGDVSANAMMAVLQEMKIMTNSMKSLTEQMNKQQLEIENLRSKHNSATETNASQDVSQTDDLEEGEIISDVINSIHTQSNNGSIAESAMPRKLITAGMPLGANVSQKIKMDIWSDKYVDLATLLDSHESTSHTIQFDPENGGLKVDKKSKHIDNIDDWSIAFDTYLSIYIEKEENTRHARDMIQYAQEIVSLAKDQYDWLYYDRQYRMDRAANPNPDPWGTLNQYVYNKVTRKGKIGTLFRPYSAKNNFGHDSTKIPKGYCFSFHTQGKRCMQNPCSYKHTCHKCNHAYPHPSFKCRQENYRTSTYYNDRYNKQQYKPDTYKYNSTYNTAYTRRR